MSHGTPTRAAIYSRQSKSSTKSIDEQTVECAADVDEQGWTIAEKYSDGVSASRYAKQARTDWPRLLSDLDGGRFDVLVLWESSRGDRDAETWLGLLRRCRDRRVRIRVTSHERTYDLAIPADWKSLAGDGIDSEYESAKTSLRLKRAVAAAARAGKPHGPVQYGYERVYGIEGGKRILIEQREHPIQGPIVREIFARLARGDAITRLEKDFAQRGVRSPRGGQFGRNTIRGIGLNIEYTGVRELHGERYPAIWPALVDQATFLAVKRRLTDPARVNTRPGRQRWLLSYLARCWCGAPLRGVPARDRPRRALRDRYECRQAGSGHVSIVAGTLGGDDMDGLDPHVTAFVVERLSRRDGPELDDGDDAAVLEARAEAARLQEKLDEWRDSAARGETSPASLARIEVQLLADIGKAQRRATSAAVPSAAVADLLDGAEEVEGVEERAGIIAERFAAAPVTVQREVIEALMDIRVNRPATRGRHIFDPDRIEVTPK